MALKIDTNQSAIAYHIVDGATVFPYAIDAQHAISSHPAEWSDAPWSAEDTAKARNDAGIPDEPMTPEEKAAIDEHNKAVAEASERLAKFRAEQEEKRKVAEQVAADEALVASPPPRPDPNVRRPFGRTGEPTPAEFRQMEKQAAKKAEDERLTKEKSDMDKASGVTVTS